MNKILIFKVEICLILFFVGYVNSSLHDGRLHKFDKLHMSPGNFDKVHNVHKNTYYTAVKAIIGKMGSILYQELPKNEKRLLARCLDNIEDRRSLAEPSKCLVIARKRLLKVKADLTQRHLEATTPHPNRNWKAFLQQFDDFGRLTPINHQKISVAPNISTSRLQKYQTKRRFGIHKAEISQSQNLTNSINSPKIPKSKRFQKFSFLKRKPTLKLNMLNNINRTSHQSMKLRSKRLQILSYRIRRSSRFPDSKDYYFKDQSFKIKSKSEMDSLTSKKDTTMISKITNVIRQFATSQDIKIEKGKEHLKWNKTYKRLMKVRQTIDDQKRMPGAKVYEHRMYDIVLGRDEASLSPSERRSPSGIMHESMKLLTRLTTDQNQSSPLSRVFSPRFMPLMPLNEGKRQPDNYFSPNIMSFYDEPNKTRDTVDIGNVPTMMRRLGVDDVDRDKVMQLLMDASGTNVHVDEALKIYENFGLFDDDVAEPILNATGNILGAFKHLEKSLFPDQRFHYDTRGFAFIKKNQVQRLLKDQGIDETEVDLRDFDIFDTMTDEEMELAVWRSIENIAQNQTNALKPPSRIRSKRQIYFLSPTIFTILAFTVQYGASVLGPIVLSGVIFSPPILGPVLFSPWVLSPGVFNPVILGPYVFSPFVLGPLGFTPFILSPYVFSPNVINPYVITSLILSPFVLSPDVLSPTAIAASVLSPSVLSPPVLNPTVVTTVALSPSFLS